MKQFLFALLALCLAFQSATAQSTLSSIATPVAPPTDHDNVITRDRNMVLQGADLDIQLDSESNIIIRGNGLNVQCNGSTGRVSIGTDSMELLVSGKSILLSSERWDGNSNHISLYDDVVSLIHGLAKNGLFIGANQTVLRGSGNAASSMTLNGGLWSSNGIRPSGKINFTETIAIRQVDTTTGPNNNSRQIAMLSFRRGPTMADERGWLGRVYHGNQDLSDGDTVGFNEFFMDTASITFLVDGVSPPKPFQEVAPKEIFRVDRVGLSLSQPESGRAQIKTSGLEPTVSYQYELQPHHRKMDPYIELDPGFAQLAGGGNLILDFMDARAHERTLKDNAVISAVNMFPGQRYSLIIRQDEAGGHFVYFDDQFKWKGGDRPIITSNASAVDLFEFRSDGTNLYEISRTQDLR